jgi:glucose-1-phosphate adenylyltransferase
MGIYVFERQVLRDLLAGCKGSDFGYDIIPAAVADYDVYGYPFEGFWADIGTIRSFYEINLMLTQPDAPFSFFDELYPIYTHPRFLPPLRADECSLRNVMVSEGCQLCEADLSDSVIGVRSVIGCNTRVTRTLMMGADYYDRGDRTDPSGRCHEISLGIGADCEIEGAILDKNVRIGDHVVIRPHASGENMVFPTRSLPGDEMYVVRDGIVVIPKNTEIPDGTVI